MSGASAVKEALWFRHLSRVFKLNVPSVPIKCDNQAALKMINNPITSGRAKHIDVQHHFIRERAARGEVLFQYVKSVEMVADTLTKALPLPQFNKCKYEMGLR
ncbi:hypothetical protein Vafri_19022 [Volvox africanus]|uniref:Uncharacterized protein n=1 Tax=Volvox africanus TaxID=51714 RepID=A0A8J4BNA2_9CHLO|nr:hypothetical protein Vafri_19022 [Volvox africanus]